MAILFVALGRATTLAADSVEVANAGGDAGGGVISENQAFNQKEYRLEAAGSWPGTTRGGTVEAIRVQGKRAYLGQRTDSDRRLASLVIMDVSVPDQPFVVGAIEFPGAAWQLELIGDRAFVAGGKGGLQVFDVRNPAKPRQVARYLATEDVLGVRRTGTRLVVLSDSGLSVFGIGTGGALVLLGQLTERWERALALDVEGNLACLASFGSGLVVVDIADPTRPFRAGGYRTRFPATGVRLVGGMAYVSESGGPFEVINVKTPARPVRVGGAPDGSVAYPTVREVANGLAYVWSNIEKGLRIIDVSRPDFLRQVGVDESIGWSSAAVWSEGLLYSGSEGLQILGVQNPEVPITLVKQATAGMAQGLEVVGDKAYLADGPGGLRILAVENPARIRSLGQVDTGGYTQDLFLIDSVAWAYDSREPGLQLVDVSRPAKPVGRGEYRTPAEGWTGPTRLLDLFGRQTYLSAGFATFLVDFDRPEAPKTLGRVGGNYEQLRRVGDLTYGCRWTGLRPKFEVLDVKDPKSPVLLATLDLELGFTSTMGGDLAELKIHEGKAYVAWARYTDAGNSGGVVVLDVTVPEKPREVSRHHFEGGVVELEFDGDLLHIGVDLSAGQRGDRGRIDMVDVGAVGGWRVAGRALLREVPTRLRVAGRRVYVSQGTQGLHVFERREGLAHTVTLDPPVPIAGAAKEWLLTARSSAGLPVEFAVAAGPAAVMGNRLVPTGTGAVTILAESQGDTRYLPASAERVVTVSGPTVIDMASIVYLSDGRVGFRVSTAPFERIVVSASDNLHSWWEDSVWTAGEEGLADVVIAVGEVEKRFYRAETRSGALP